MKTDEIKRRLLSLEQKSAVETFCIVRFPDGSEHETALIDWIDHAADWKMLKITQGRELSPLLCSLLSLEEQAVREDQESGADPAVCDDHIRSRDAVLRFIEYAGGIK